MNLFENSIHYISIKELELANLFFEFNMSDNNDFLVRSISRHGIIHPLWVYWNNKTNVILSGFKRVNAALHTGLNEVPVRRLCDNIPLEQAFKYVIEEQQSFRALNVIETAKILHIVQRLGCSMEIRSHFLSLLNLPDNKGLLKKYMRTLELTNSVQTYIAQCNMSLKQTDMFRGFNKEEQGLLIYMAETLNMKSHELREISVQLYEISRRAKKTVKEVWQFLELSQMLGDTSKNRNQQIDVIRQRLKQERFPILVKNHHRLEEELSSLIFRSKGKWRWDPTFESPGLVYNFMIIQQEDFEDIINDFSDLRNRKILSDILKRI